VLTGASRVAQAASEEAEALAGAEETGRRQRELQQKRTTLEEQIAVLRSEQQSLSQQAGTRTRLMVGSRTELARLRQADAGKRPPLARGEQMAQKT